MHRAAQQRHDLGLRHFLDRLQNEHNVLAKLANVFLAEIGHDLVHDFHPALQEVEVSLAFHFVQAGH